MVRIAGREELGDSMAIDDAHLFADVIPSSRDHVTEHQQSIVVFLVDEMIGLAEIDDSFAFKSLVERGEAFEIGFGIERNIKADCVR